jgi:hypothetical protein
MADEEKAKEFFARYGVEDLPRFCDPEKKLYQEFGLETGSFLRVLGPRSFIRGLQAIKHGIGAPAGDPWQMPGTFLIHKGEILQAFINETVSDKPDYEGMICSLSS